MRARRLGRYVRGAGKGCRDMVMLTLGTASRGIVLDGKLRRVPTSPPAIRSSMATRKAPRELRSAGSWKVRRRPWDRELVATSRLEAPQTAARSGSSGRKLSKVDAGASPTKP